ncbi:MAG: hydrogenase formation protein HypD [Pirellulales bacterium]
MKFVDEFRDPQAAQRLAARIQSVATRRWTLMEVCGGQTHSLLRHGIDAELNGVVELIHGPGCPVCVTPAEAIDNAIDLARRPGVEVLSFGDMLRVPGSGVSMAEARARGAKIRAVYSPLDAVQHALAVPDIQVVFFAVGFETTVPATALAAAQARALGLKNFTLLVSHVRVQPAMELLAADPESQVEAFLAAGHVCAVLGAESYESFVERFRRPVVVTGFEPTDLLEGILTAVEQLERGEAAVSNRYQRGVQRAGNPVARRLIDSVLEPCDQAWRGLGIIPSGGLRLREDWGEWDARRRFALAGANELAVLEGGGECPAGDVLVGRLKPTQCPHFGVRCTPDSPLGAPMVSAEGACAAYFRYAR